MKLILGLGNPGEKYRHTRHNAGFLFLDYLREQWKFPEFESIARFDAALSSGLIDGEKIILGKPEGFMNLSGKSASDILHYYKLSEKDLSVIHDDLDIAQGAIKTTLSSSCAGHNGVSDIIERLGTQDFFRIRIGIGRPENNQPIHDYVLKTFPDKELASLEKEVFPIVLEKLREHLKKK